MNSASVISRKQQLQSELDRILPILIHEYKAEKVIAFGSSAHGQVGEWSDLDLAVIKNTKTRFLDRTLEISRLLNSTIATDIIVYTPDELHRMQYDNYFVRDEILGKGNILYDQNKP